MGKKGKKGQAGKPKKLTPKDVGKRLNALAKKVEEELKGADLFAPLPPTEDCPICLVPLSRIVSNSTYFACCGNVICTGCVEENGALIKRQNEEKNAMKSKTDACPFCRELRPFEDGYIRQLQARCLLNDHTALTVMGKIYQMGKYETPKDYLKALDYWVRAVELGSPDASKDIGECYFKGWGVSEDMDRADFFLRVGALRGCIVARHNIGCSEYYRLGNHEIGIRHWKIAAEAGSQLSLDSLRTIYNADSKQPGKELISKECMDSLYRVCHDAQEEVQSEERGKHCTGNDATKMKC